MIDPTVIALALRKKAPIMSGDKDLTYVARREGIETIWLSERGLQR